MRKRITLLLIGAVLAGQLTGSVARADESADRANDWSLGTSDKKIHFLASYGLAMTGTAYFRSKKLGLGTSILLSTLGTLAIGVAKERFLDSQWSQGDLKANVLGIASGAVVSFVIQF